MRSTLKDWCFFYLKKIIILGITLKNVTLDTYNATTKTQVRQAGSKENKGEEFQLDQILK